MSMGLAFWICMLLALLHQGLCVLRSKDYAGAAWGLIPWILFLLLGWRTFGAPITG